jgi:hypothetical protein
MPPSDNVCVAETDWRLWGQEKYLTGATLLHRRWSQLSEGWDHDHCAFCWATFMSDEHPNALHEGWTTPDEDHWICETCFRDFRERFHWLVVSN